MDLFAAYVAGLLLVHHVPWERNTLVGEHLTSWEMHWVCLDGWCLVVVYHDSGAAAAVATHRLVFTVSAPTEQSRLTTKVAFQVYHVALDVGYSGPSNQTQVVSALVLTLIIKRAQDILQNTHILIHFAPGRALVIL
jgi:hypothetical protein